ncbi:MAG TPA: hypothetical protein VI815_03805 [Candidatus Nanoarchaeia archaeon]|nr:hypothetical protein [Candidatus Nanoarchaeia archaeon]
MRKEVVIFLILILAVSAGAFAQSISENDIGQNVEDYIKGFIKNDGIKSEHVNKIKKIDPNQLPAEVDIQEISDNYVGIYEVNYSTGNESKKVFVVTYSSDNLDSKTEIKNIQYLSFGISGSINSSTYLESSVGVKTSGEVGYVMMRSGSITGISTSLEIYSGDGELEIRVYKNGKDTGFNNLISSDGKRKVDYDLQSEEIVNYNAGDVISVYVYQNGELNWGNVVTLIESTS